MYHNALDLEMHARFIRDRAMEEAERARRVNGIQHPDARRARLRFRLPSAVRVIRVWFDRRAEVTAGTRQKNAEGEPARRYRVGPIDPVQPFSSSRRIAAADPYAGMIVVARGETKRLDRSRNLKEC
jgi:hypothetical protein